MLSGFEKLLSVERERERESMGTQILGHRHLMRV
jgi:hypothetical protein